MELYDIMNSLELKEKEIITLQVLYFIKNHDQNKVITFVSNILLDSINSSLAFYVINALHQFFNATARAVPFGCHPPFQLFCHLSFHLHFQLSFLLPFFDHSSFLYSNAIMHPRSIFI